MYTATGRSHRVVFNFCMTCVSIIKRFVMLYFIAKR